MPDLQAVIVGGGIAGLATGYELAKRGIPFLILESASRAGGSIFTEEIDGFTIDAGPDALLAQKPEGIALCRELGLGDRLVPTNLPRLAYIQRAGRLHPLPAASVIGLPTRVSSLVGTSLFSWTGKIRMGAEWLVPPRQEDTDESIGHFIRRRFGREAATYLAEPLLAGIHAGDVNRLSLRALFPRFADAERKHGSLLRAFSRTARVPERTRAPEGAFRSFPRGLGELVRALVAALPHGSLRLGAPVVNVSKTGMGSPYRVETTGAPPISVPVVVLAAPAYISGGVVRNLDAALASLCLEVPYTSTATVNLAFPPQSVANPLRGSGFVVPRVENAAILAASWMSSKWPGRAPDGSVLMRAFVGGARDPGALDRSDDELVELSVSALGPLLGFSRPPQFTRVYRFVRANAQHEVGHLERMAAIEQALTRHPGLFVTGSGFRGVGIPDCIADARATAEAVATALEERKTQHVERRT